MKNLEMFEGTSAKAIAARLELTRTVFGLSQYEFAKRAKIGRTAYNMYECAKRIPNLSAALNLCETYDLTLDWIYRGDPSSLSLKLAESIRNHKLSIIVTK